MFQIYVPTLTVWLYFIVILAVFIVVEPIDVVKSDQKFFRVGCAQKSHVPLFEPSFIDHPSIVAEDSLRDFILAKGVLSVSILYLAINGQRAAYKSGQLSNIVTNTKNGLLVDLVDAYLKD